MLKKIFALLLVVISIWNSTTAQTTVHHNLYSALNYDLPEYKEKQTAPYFVDSSILALITDSTFTNLIEFNSDSFSKKDVIKFEKLGLFNTKKLNFQGQINSNHGKDNDFEVNIRLIVDDKEEIWQKVQVKIVRFLPKFGAVTIVLTSKDTCHLYLFRKHNTYISNQPTYIQFIAQHGQTKVVDFVKDSLFMKPITVEKKVEKVDINGDSKLTTIITKDSVLVVDRLLARFEFLVRGKANKPNYYFRARYMNWKDLDYPAPPNSALSTTKKEN